MNLTDLHQSKHGQIAVVACLVQTLNETDPTFQARFLARLEAAYYDFRDNPVQFSKNDYLALEPMAWIREMLTGWNRIDGQQEIFLSDYKPKQSNTEG